MVIDVKPATTLAEAADQMEEAMGMCVDHYVNVCDVVLSNWSMLCRSVDVDALLALAEELDGLGRSGFSSGWSSGAVNVGSFARRIREALGVSE